MVDVRPFRALRPAPGLESRVVSPPYDVVDVEEARAYAGGDSASFLRVSRPEIDLPDDVDPHSAEVYERGRANLAEFLERGVLVADAEPTYSVYRQVMGEVVQTGVVAAVSVDDYDAGRVRIHEFTRPDKEDDRVRHIEALDAQDEPVFLLSRRSADVDEIVARVTRLEPRVDLVARDGVSHTLWVVDDPAEVAALHRALSESGDLYVADGHHRSAAASRVHAARRDEGGTHDAFLAVVFPMDDVHVMAYHRVVADLADRSVEELLVALDEAGFDVAAASGAVSPARAHEFGVHVDGDWFVASARDVDEEDPLARLDVSVLQDRVLGPLLGIGDPRTDARIAFVGGIRGTGEIERLVGSGRYAVGFSLFPT
ncbi:MAG TPA: DUF1015 domain-containing protein, partial [Candidatus Nanopelagicales bacterium]|nr:DUF1015 domain-containing protein [Candidatus Nanopelagicales bacterium]